MCNESNKIGFICGKCCPTFGPSAKSFNCHKCHLSLSSAIALYLTVKLLPTTVTVLFIIIMMFRINIFMQRANVVLPTASHYVPIYIHVNHLVEIYPSLSISYCYIAVINALLVLWKQDFVINNLAFILAIVLPIFHTY